MNFSDFFGFARILQWFCTGFPLSKDATPLDKQEAPQANKQKAQPGKQIAP